MKSSDGRSALPLLYQFGDYEIPHACHRLSGNTPQKPILTTTRKPYRKIWFQIHVTAQSEESFRQCQALSYWFKIDPTQELEKNGWMSPFPSIKNLVVYQEIPKTSVVSVLLSPLSRTALAISEVIDAGKGWA